MLRTLTGTGSEAGRTGKGFTAENFSGWQKKNRSSSKGHVEKDQGRKKMGGKRADSGRIEETGEQGLNRTNPKQFEEIDEAMDAFIEPLIHF